MPVLSFAGCSCFIGGLAEPLDEGADIAFGLGEAGLVGADEGVVVGGLVGDVHGVGVEDPGGGRLFQVLYLVAELVVGLPARDGALGHDGMRAEGGAEERLGGAANEMMENLVWKAYYHSMSGHEIRPFNIFEHGRFREEVRKLLLKCTEKEAFAEELRRSLFYYYCSKCEWEVVIGPWCGDRGTKEIKVDVYMQVMNNWDIFVDYVWNEGKKQRR